MPTVCHQVIVRVRAYSILRLRHRVGFQPSTPLPIFHWHSARPINSALSASTGERVGVTCRKQCSGESSLLNQRILSPDVKRAPREKRFSSHCSGTGMHDTRAVVLLSVRAIQIIVRRSSLRCEAVIIVEHSTQAILARDSFLLRIRSSQTARYTSCPGRAAGPSSL